LEVHGIPDFSEWCRHPVQQEDTLAGIAQAYGMHWITLFLMLVAFDV
jgi:hypothetical protein